MKYTLAILLFLNSALGFGQVAEFFFHEAEHKFPKTEEGVFLTHDFVFKNVGDAPLFITNIKVNCMCTKYTFPMKPVPPGAQDTIHVTFDTEGKAGYQIRDLEIFANTAKNPTTIRFKTFVKKKKH